MKSLYLEMNQQFQLLHQPTLLSQQPHQQKKKPQRVDQLLKEKLQKVLHQSKEKLLKVQGLLKEKLLKALHQSKEKLLKVQGHLKEKLLKVQGHLKEKLLKVQGLLKEKLQMEHHLCKFLQLNLPGYCLRGREDQEDLCCKYFGIFGSIIGINQKNIEINDYIAQVFSNDVFAIKHH